MATDIVIRATRPLVHRGRSVATGETLRLPALQAAECIGSGRAELAHAGDLDAVRAAERDELHRTLRALGRVRVADVPPSPWQPWR